jgi:hypothetical protein
MEPAQLNAAAEVMRHQDRMNDHKIGKKIGSIHEELVEGPK